MPANAIAVFTDESIRDILSQGGTSHWRLNPRHAEKMDFVVCIRSTNPDGKERPELQYSAFLVGKVIPKVMPFPKNKKRYSIQFSEYAKIDKRNRWKGDRNPVKYIDIKEIGINPLKLKWERISAQNYWVANTNEKNVPNKLNNHKVWFEKGFALTNGGLKYGQLLDSINPGDVILAYASGLGIVGVGIAKDKWDKKKYLKNKLIPTALVEYRIPVEWNELTKPFPHQRMEKMFGPQTQAIRKIVKHLDKAKTFFEKFVSEIKISMAAPSGLDTIDDLDQIPDGIDVPSKIARKTSGYKRDLKVRQFVLQRAKGCCEFCGEKGFLMLNKFFYIETHHIIALADAGKDTLENVIALCPKHHREAHYGMERKSLEIKMHDKLKILLGAGVNPL